MNRASIAIIGDNDAAYTGHRHTCEAPDATGRRVGVEISYQVDARGWAAA